MAMIENEMEKKVYKVEDVQNLLGLGRSKACLLYTSDAADE